MANKKEFESQVTKFSGKRKIIEVPAKVREHFKTGEKVHVKKIKKGK